MSTRRYPQPSPGQQRRNEEFQIDQQFQDHSFDRDDEQFMRDARRGSQFQQQNAGENRGRTRSQNQQEQENFYDSQRYFDQNTYYDRLPIDSGYNPTHQTRRQRENQDTYAPNQADQWFAQPHRDRQGNWTAATYDRDGAVSNFSNGDSDYRNRRQYTHGSQQGSYGTPHDGYSSSSAPSYFGHNRGFQHGSGHFRNKGPKGYTRSDDRIKEDVCERFMQSDTDASEVTVDVKDGCVILEGTVPERSMRYHLEHIAESCMGVKDIDNKVKVERDDMAILSTQKGSSTDKAGGDKGSSKF